MPQQPTPAPMTAMAALGYDLPALLTLQADGEGAWLSPHADLNIQGAIFGGQLIGQCIWAAGAALGAEWCLHSLQLSFLSPGRSGAPLRYEVRPLLQGRRYTVLQVLAVQNGRPVIAGNVSFNCPEGGPRYHQPMPEGVPAPESLQNVGELMREHPDRVPPEAFKGLGNSTFLDLRLVDGADFLFARQPQVGFRYWIKARHALPEGGAGPRLQEAAFGYLSDYWFPFAAITPHVDDKINAGLYIASLNHSFWLHTQPPQADEWLFVDADAPFAGGSRGLSTARFYRRDGTLVAQVNQEGVQRGWQPGPAGAWLPPGLAPTVTTAA